MAQHNLLGNKGEMLASRYLLDKGYAIHHHNWRCGHKEIDIIAQQRDTLVFVEVKSRTSEEFGNAYDAVDNKKIKLLISAAQAYINKYSIDLKFRFDIITVTGEGEPYKIEHIEDAFYPEW
ncbi:MAG: YraN family protein [Bacteroidaceae bacterium]|nr:YraN family protein [Bacteroidaceae bacterium]